jgi:phthiocerol/phenolphthiocerol synthesis type-I polyketide synthase D
MTTAPVDRRAIITEALHKIDELNRRLEIAEKGDTEPIAVVGMGCRFPGGVNSPDQYWHLLTEGRSGIVRVPAERWDADAFYCTDRSVPGTICTREGGFLTSWQPDEFDAEFFSISPREAAAMDPQQRLLLEVAWEALEDAGITAAGIRGSHTSVYIGLTANDYSLTLAATMRPQHVDAYASFGNAANFAAGRLSYFLGVRGPALVIDTACSSSLVSVHLACQSLRRRESDTALAAGANLILRPENSVACSLFGMLSPDGRCKTFDADADGYVRSEGCGVVVLKRLTDAVRDGDRVLAVVRGSAVNQDGASSGQTVPNGPAQQALLRQALAASRLQPSDIDYIEAHGTGTALGDPIELDALSHVFAERDGSAPLVLGSVKTNIGHLESAAGIAGFIKAVLSVRHGHIPKHLHFERLTPHASDGASRFTIASEPMAWPATPHPRRAGVSSFGVSGTNAHVVLEQGPDPVPVRCVEPVVTTLVVSGKTAERIGSMAGMLADWLEGPGAQVALVDVAHTVNHHRSRSARFASVCARDRVSAVAGLRAVAAGRSGPGVVGPHGGSCGSGTVFVYSGQGSQWAGMGRRLLVEEPEFAAAVAELDPVFSAQTGFSLREVLEAGGPLVGIDRIQPVLVGVQLALTQLWRSYGVSPDAVIGHSMGEVSAAVVAGALTVAEGLRVIATRSRLMARLAGRGAMALLELDAAETEAVIAGHPELALAVYASPRQTVIAGPPDQVDAVCAVVDAQDRLARRIEVDVASHHRTVDPILPELRTALAGLAPRQPTIPLISCTDHTDGQAAVFDADYWVANLRNPVRFTQAVATAAQHHTTFLEISPHPLLTHAITETLTTGHAQRDVHVSGTLNRDTDDVLAFHTQLAGVRPPAVGDAPQDAASGRLTDIPPTPWMHTRYWLASRPVGQGAIGAHPLLGNHVQLPSGTDHFWQADVGIDVLPWLADHRVHGQVIMPAAGFAEMALAAGSEALETPVQSVRLARLEVEQMLPLADVTRVTTQVSRAADDGLRIEVHSQSTLGTWNRHAVAHVEIAEPTNAAVPPTSVAEAGDPVPIAEFYSALRRTGAHHGQAFAALTRIVRMPDSSAETDIVLPDEAVPHRGFRIHPVMLDAALQTLAAAMPADALGDHGEVTYLPVSIESIRLLGNVGRRARCRAELIGLDDHGAGKLGRITLMDEEGTPTAEITGVYLRRVDRRTVPLPLPQRVFDTTWVDSPLLTGAGPEHVRESAGSWLLLYDGSENESSVNRFATVFGSSSRRVLTEDLTDEQAMLEAFARTADDPELPPVGVVVFVGHRPFDDEDAGSLSRAKDLIWSVSATLRAMVGGWHGRSPRLWLVSCSGLAVADEPGNPAIGALRGLIRVLAYEHPDVHATLVDLDGANGSDAALALELGQLGNDDVIAWRGGNRFVERLTRATLPSRRRGSVVRPDGSYVLTGGLGGLGLVVARWLVDRGAGRVVLNGRSGPDDEQARELADLAGSGDVVFIPGDIASRGLAERLVTAAEETGLPLRGVVHGAAVIDDGLVMSLTRESLERVWAPKAVGALRLHQASADRQLDWWVGFSSVASLLGSPGQAAYACANACLDAMVTWRRAAGLPANTINWGQWSDVGIARAMNFGVLDPISPAEGVEALEVLVGSDLTRVGVARLRLDRAAATFPEIKDVGYFAHLVEESDAMSTGGDWPGPDALRDLEPGEAADVITDRLRERTSKIMGYLEASAIPVDQPLTELGMDSLMAVRIRNSARSDFGVEAPVALLLQGATLQDLTTDLVRQLGLRRDEPDVPPNGLRDRVNQRAGARQRAAARRRVGQRT